MYKRKNAIVFPAVNDPGEWQYLHLLNLNFMQKYCFSDTRRQNCWENFDDLTS